MLVKDMHVGYLKAITIKEIILALEGVSLNDSVDNFVNHYRTERYPRILSIIDVARVVKTLTPIFGMPISYEVIENFKHDNTYHARLVKWRPKNFSALLKLCNQCAELGITYYVNKNLAVKIYAPEDCFIPNLFKSDHPHDWESLNKISFDKLKVRRKIRAVGKKLDGV